MTFFNKKEDVISLELTPYGRKLLSSGELKPEYYAFFDDDVLYDSARGNFTENNSQIKTRILSETVSLKPLASNSGVETNINTQYEKMIDNSMLYSIGTSSPAEKKGTGWNAIMLSNEISSSSLTSSLNSSILAIPQINCEVEFTMSLGNMDTYEGDYSELANSYDIEFDVNGNFIKIEDEDVLLYLMEKNGFVDMKSFELEVFLYEEDESDLKKLNFFGEKHVIVNDILTMGMPNPDMEPTPDHVEYYMDILLDGQIPDEDICAGIDKLQDGNIHLNLDLVCPERVPQGYNIYNSTVGDLEECD